MDTTYHSTSIAKGFIGNITDDVTLPSTLPLTLPPAGSGPCLAPAEQQPSGPAPPYTKHDLDNKPKTPPPRYIESNRVFIDGDCKAPPYFNEKLQLHALLSGAGISSTPPSPSLHPILATNCCDDNCSPCIGASKELGLPQKMYNRFRDNSSAGLNITSLLKDPFTFLCGTIYTLASRNLNFDIYHDKYVLRWKPNAPINVSIDMKSFEPKWDGDMVRRCLKAVLNSFNAENVGPGFMFVDEPSESAFYVAFGGASDYYASAFFPGSPPQDWCIYVYDLGLLLDGDQEKKLKKILTHELLHVLGVRHCNAHEIEQDSFRYPLDLSDQKNMGDGLMMPQPDLTVDWMSRTLQEIREIYQMMEGHKIGQRTIKDVKWRDEVRKRIAIAQNHARCCNPKLQDNE